MKHRVRMRGILDKYYKDPNEEVKELSPEEKAELEKQCEKELAELTLEEIQNMMEADRQAKLDKRAQDSDWSLIQPKHSTTAPVPMKQTGVTIGFNPFPQQELNRQSVDPSLTQDTPTKELKARFKATNLNAEPVE